MSGILKGIGKGIGEGIKSGLNRVGILGPVNSAISGASKLAKTLSDFKGEKQKPINFKRNSIVNKLVGPVNKNPVKTKPDFKKIDTLRKTMGKIPNNTPASMKKALKVPKIKRSDIKIPQKPTAVMMPQDTIENKLAKMGFGK